jgi:hypothetical protein
MSGWKSQGSGLLRVYLLASGFVTPSSGLLGGKERVKGREGKKREG